MYTKDDLLNIVKRINELNDIIDNENTNKEVYDKAIDEFADIKTDLMRDWNTRFNNYDTARFALDSTLDFYGVMESEGDDTYKLNVYMKNRTIDMDTYDMLEFESIILHHLRWVVGYVKKESDD
jgi:hypothetical protein